MIEILNDSRYAIRYFYRVGPRLTDDANANDSLTVESDKAFRVLGRKCDFRHVTYTNVIAHNKRCYVILFSNRRIGPNQQLLIACAEAPCGYIKGRGSQHRCYIGNS